LADSLPLRRYSTQYTARNIEMGALDVLTRKKGVIVGDDVMNVRTIAAAPRAGPPPPLTRFTAFHLRPAAQVRHSRHCTFNPSQLLPIPLTVPSERHLLLDRCRVPRGCPRCQVPHHPPGVPGRCRVLCRKGIARCLLLDDAGNAGNACVDVDAIAAREFPTPTSSLPSTAPSLPPTTSAASLPRTASPSFCTPTTAPRSCFLG
jgi:hypothetical protein